MVITGLTRNQLGLCPREFESRRLRQTKRTALLCGSFIFIPEKSPKNSKKKLIRGDLVEDSDGAFLLPGVKVAVSIPGHLHVGVPKPARYLLNVYSLVDE